MTHDPTEINSHPATTAEQCEEMERINGWTLIGVEPSGVPILEVNCIFEGPQTNFADLDPYADLEDDHE
jgi:hypothetical protein